LTINSLWPGVNGHAGGKKNNLYGKEMQIEPIWQFDRM